MIFAIVVGVADGPMVIACTSIEMLLDRMRTQLKETEDTVHEVGLWCLRAVEGDWLDWERGWIFACSTKTPLLVRDEHEWKAKH